MSTNPTDKQLVTIVLIFLGAVVVLPALFMEFGMMGFGPMTGGCGAVICGVTEQSPGG